MPLRSMVDVLWSTAEVPGATAPVIPSSKSLDIQFCSAIVHFVYEIGRGRLRIITPYLKFFRAAALLTNAAFGHII